MKKVVIIGAGPAGLTAAYELLRQSKQYEVVVLEAGDDIGGISKTVRHNGNRMDIGGHRFFSKDDRIMNLWSEIMPVQGAPAYDYKKLGKTVDLAQGGPDPETEDGVMLIRQRVSRIYYKHHFFDYPVSLKWDTIKNMGFATTIAAGFSYLKAMMFKKPENNLENFYINRFGKKLYQMFFEGYTEKLWGRHPSVIAADWGSQRVKGISISAVLKDMLHKLSGKKNDTNTETSLIERFWYPKYGPGQLWERMAHEVQKMGGMIQMNSPVTQVFTDNDRVTGVAVQTENGRQIVDADIVISSMPIKDLIAAIEDEKPKEISEIAEGLPYRDFVTVGLLVNRLNLKNQTKIPTLGDVVPDCWIYVQDTNVKLGRIQIFNNWSPYMVKDPDHTVWIGLEYFCNEGDDFWNLTDEECIHQAIQELITMGILEDEDVLDSHREKVRKAYPAYFDTYYQMDRVIEYLNRFESLYCVGRNGQHRYNNMDHSMLTSILAAQQIQTGNVDKNAIWNVNSDQEYHEEKK